MTLLEERSNCLNASLEVSLVLLAEIISLFPPTRFFGASHPSEVINRGVFESDSWTDHSDVDGAFFVFKEQLWFRTDCVRHEIQPPRFVTSARMPILQANVKGVLALLTRPVHESLF